MKIVTLSYDDSPESPSEWDGWKLYSFSGRHVSHRHPDEFFPNGKPSLAIRRKLEVGTAFLLSYYEHGGCVWSLRGEGPQCQWDSVDVAGILVWEQPAKNLGPKTKEDREKDAAGFLKTYTQWCNGEVYGYSVEDVKTLPCGHQDEPTDVDSCYGFYDLEEMAAEVREAIDGDPDVRIEGKAKDLADFHNFGQSKKKKTA